MGRRIKPSARASRAGCLRAGAPPDAVDHLQGHVISGSRGRYIDPMVAYDLVEVVGRVPARLTTRHRVPVPRSISNSSRPDHVGRPVPSKRRPRRKSSISESAVDIVAVRQLGSSSSSRLSKLDEARRSWVLRCTSTAIQGCRQPSPFRMS